MTFSVFRLYVSDWRLPMQRKMKEKKLCNYTIVVQNNIYRIRRISLSHPVPLKSFQLINMINFKAPCRWIHCYKFYFNKNSFFVFSCRIEYVIIYLFVLVVMMCHTKALHIINWRKLLSWYTREYASLYSWAFHIWPRPRGRWQLQIYLIRF